VQNLDDETAGSPAVIVLTGDGLITGEDATGDAFQVVLNNQPSADVTIGPIASTDTGEVVLFPANLTFTTSDWSTPQVVNLAGVDDDFFDGTQTVTINLGNTLSTDADWNGIVLGTINVHNIDNDAPKGITVLAGTALLVSESGSFSEFEVVLDSAPSATVNIDVSSSDPGEGAVASPAAGVLQFTAGNWNIPQAVRVTGMNDQIADGNQTFSIILGAASSSDPDYNGMNPPDIAFTNIDDDTPGITVSAGSSMLVSESGTTSSFELVLNSRPTAAVDITVASNDTAEGDIAAPVSGTVSFTTGSWNVPQTVVVQGVDDAAVDGNQAFTVILGTAVSGDPDYNGLNPSDIAFTNIDDDDPATKSIAIQAGSSTLVSESGSSSTFDVVLSAAPLSDVDIPVLSSDTNDGIVTNPVTNWLTFTTGNWNVPQTVTVAGVDDALADGNQGFTVLIGAAVSADTDYNGQDPPDLAFICVDDDSPGITVSAGSSMLVSESGSTSTFQVVLNSEPTAAVTIPVAEDDPSEADVIDPATGSLVFTTGNWNLPQDVEVTGMDDSENDDNEPFSVILGVTSSGDANYSGLNPPDVAFINVDDETPGVTIDVGDGIITSETGLSDNILVVLNSRPTAGVSFGTLPNPPIQSSNTSEVTVGTTSISFTTANWNVPKSITVTGADDGLLDGMQTALIDLGLAISTDPDYSGMDPGDVQVNNIDDEAQPKVVVLNAMNGFYTSENGASVDIQVVLSQQPTGQVDLLSITSSDTNEGTVSPSSLTFTPVDWNVPHIITVTGNALAPGPDMPYTIDLGIATSTDPNWNGVPTAPIAVTNLAFVDVQNYGYLVFAGSFSTIAGASQVTFREVDYSDGYAAEDEGYEYLPIGFTFYYCGMPYEEITVYSNGFASLNPYHNTYNTFANDYLFSTGTNPDLYINILAPWWEDLTMDRSDGHTGAVYYETAGPIGNRVFTVEWNEAINPVLFPQPTDDFFTFQLKLFEFDNHIEFVYGPYSDLDANDDTSASMGIKDDIGGNNHFIDAFDGSTTGGNPNCGVADFPPMDTVIQFTP
jgi:hypothetical protein